MILWCLGNIRDQTLRFDLVANRISADHLPAPLTLTKGLQYELTVAASERTGERAGAIRFFPNGSSTGGRVSVVSARQAYHVDVEWFTGRTRILSEAIDAH